VNRRVPLRVVAALGLLAACGEDPAPPPAQPSPLDGRAGVLALADVTPQSGVDFAHDNGRTSRRYLPETMGGGLAILDADGDGLPELFFVDSGAVEAGGARRPGALYRNLGGMRFAPAGDRSGLDRPILGQGTAVGDVDGDGDCDLLITGVGADHLYLNRGDGSFVAVEPVGWPEPGFSSSAAFVDFDRDGRLDLFLGRYVTWSPQTDVACRPDGEHRTYCTPEVYDGATNRLLRNVGDGRFVDVTREAGLYRPDGKTLGVVPIDADGDGWPDLVVANDTTGNFLFLNQRDGTFVETGTELGLAFGPSGAPRGSMGIDAGDVDGDGRPDLLVANFAQEMSAVFVSSPSGLWTDSAAALGVGLPSLMTLAFGALLTDLDLDGTLDAFLANGHIEPEIDRYQATQSYAQPLAIFHGRAGGFEEVPRSEVPGGELVGRALGAADLDGDGDLDLIVTQNGGSPRIFENRSLGGAWLRLVPRGETGPREAYGLSAKATVDGRRVVASLVSGRSYLTAPEGVVTLGLGGGALDALELSWPSGRRQRVMQPPAGRVLAVVEPRRTPPLP